jgi:hypothetical protein
MGGSFRRGSVVVVLAALAAIALPSSASAGQPFVNLKVAKKQDGPYKNVQNVNIDLNEAKSFYWKAKNPTSTKLDVLLTDPSFYPVGWNTRWFRGNDDITEEVRAAGYEFGLKAGKAKLFRSRLKPTKTAGPVCHEGNAAPPKTSTDFALVAVNDPVCLL